MTRQEWFNKQTKKVQKQFKYNCDNAEGGYGFDKWVEAEVLPSIGGAFVWDDSEEGHAYWREIDKQ